jgi:hypothetical protein
MGVMQQPIPPEFSASIASGDVRPQARYPLIQLRLSSLRSLSLRNLPPQGGEGVRIWEAPVFYPVLNSPYIRSSQPLRWR